MTNYITYDTILQYVFRFFPVLEIVFGLIPQQEFESLSLRHVKTKLTHCVRLGFFFFVIEARRLVSRQAHATVPKASNVFTKLSVYDIILPEVEL